MIIKRADLRKDGTDFELIQRGQMFSVFDQTLPHGPYENYYLKDGWTMSARAEVSLWLIGLGFEIVGYTDD
jgi:hypothetical protein